MYCSNCGEKMNENATACQKCGQVVGGAIATEAVPSHDKAVPVKATRSRGSTFLWIAGLIFTLILACASFYLFIKMKTEFKGWLIAIGILALSGLLQKILGRKSFKAVLIIFTVTLVSVGVTFSYTTRLEKGFIKSLFEGNQGVVNDSVSVGQDNTIKQEYDISSVVSLGVNRDDLGNIMNGQYYFDDGENIFYSTFDQNSVPHIYKKAGNGKAVPIFDGFGWSLVVYNNWLYFSGNAGTVIDGSYNLFRIKTDGSQVEKINTGFCYNMSFYDKWLYYIKKSSYESTDYSFCRSSIEGTNEEVIINNGGNCGIVYNNKIYYLDNRGFCMTADQDGKNPSKVLQSPIKFFIIGNGSLVYLDSSSNILTADMDGTNIKQVRQAGINPPYTINSYKDNIFYTQYNQAVDGRSAYNYDLNSIKFDGANDKNIYSGVSYGFYVNIVNDKVYVLDYAVDPSSGIMIAVAKNMGLKGNGIQDLDR